ncbi:GDP-mannose-dependent alpha-(1-6)-phosphatidylinositol dimannoside mannosyltransferase [Variibacter gotjawalensis]|uniref:GDP-mannose-dependent alpha-(1-6)-phosphatidylinositol dimannoside mannosyltransferase n=1 Tax=Variibacter gotjawalensis TaxID=1333996 RepID=A0A0S3PX20_9BRAD|nr:glycosyltransferase family 4 protein [Variibacter gotjawalensis]NIK46294.1 glycosyltransferase involved in cell wall biosynthesis [Variibacter gotjawalensis]RZS48209.1 glycosyltransferase involved in cell wall biosynthesis [Variibacter gotjawalensis]BAT60466.1 GDP-mannose-dependent alpha-(1-6)-phosphatidylinositol dimannoside mannosyltransferase [Variibacter gotjawalensis]
MKVACVVGIVTPYTHRMFEQLGAELEGELVVFACGDNEPGRHWTLPAATTYTRKTLKGIRLHRSYVSHIYLNPGIVPAIMRGQFDVVMIGDFSPTMMLAKLAGRLRGVPVIISTDGQPDTDPGRHSLLHRIARRLVVPSSAGGVGASRGSIKLLESYGLRQGTGTIVWLTPGWDFDREPPPYDERPFDLMFCGHLDEDRKGALFFADVVAALVARGRTPKVRITGEGPLRDKLLARLKALNVPTQFDGYLGQAALGDAYASAKVFLFPSRGDPWGLVANEALQCGTPVIVSPHAQAGRELVAPSGAGRMLPLDVEAWADTAETFLDDRAVWAEAHRRAQVTAERFSLDAMVRNTLSAFARVVGDGPEPNPARTGR